jgi:hypothetical protein
MIVEYQPGTPGRPPEGGVAKTLVQARVTAAQLKTAKRLGDGCISAGIRAALEACGDGKK